MIRDFMPGECTLGPDAAVFNKMDQDPEVVVQNPQLAEVAGIICQSCVQLPHCETQRAGIVDVLSARGIGRTVVAGEIAERVEPTEPDPRLHEPKFRFDLLALSKLPTPEPKDPEQRLRIIHQGLLSGQLPMKGRLRNQHIALRPDLFNTLASERPEWTEIEIGSVIDTLIPLALKLRDVQKQDLTYGQRNKPLATEEVNDVKALLRVFADQVQALKSMNARDPTFTARFHSADFYAALTHRYEGSTEISPGTVRDVLARIADPVAKLKQIALTNRQHKENANANGLSEEVAAALTVGGRRQNNRIQTVLREENLSFVSRKSGVMHYVRLIVKGNTTPDTAAKARSFVKRVRKLSESHDDVRTDILAYIVFHKIDANRGIEDFKHNLRILQDTYGRHPDFTPAKLERMAVEADSEEQAQKAAQTYLKRIDETRKVCSRENLVTSEGFVRYFAYHDGTISADRVSAEYERYRLRYRRKQDKHLEPWMRELIVGLHEREEHVVIGANLSTFIRRGYLRTAFASEATANTDYNRIDPKKGRYVAWSTDFLALTPEEREAILHAAGLDRLVLGRDADANKLKAHFGIDDVLQYVDKYVLPCTLYKPYDGGKQNNPHVLLEALRYKIRDDSNQGSLKKEQQQKLDVIFPLLLEELRAEAIDDSELADKACQQALMILIRRAIRKAPGRAEYRGRLLSVARLYLQDAHRIREMGLKRPYEIALGYSADFCDHFISRANKKDVTKGRASRILQETTMQALVSLRSFQRMLREYEPRFAQRDVGRGYYAYMVFHFRRNPQFIDKALQDYDTNIKRFPDIRYRVIRHFCFKTGKDKDPRVEIEAWRKAIQQLDPAHKKAMAPKYIEEMAYYRRGDDLVEAINDRLRTINDIMRENERAPHPGIGRSIVEFAATRAHPRKWLKDNYLVRWKYVEDHINTNGIELPILRQLVLVDTKNPGSTIKVYQALCQKYAGDPYITQSIINEAVFEDAVTLVSRLARKRKEMERDKAYAMSIDNTTSEALSRDNAALSPEDIVVGKLEGITREQQMIAELLKPATAMEKAVVAVVYNTSWLAPDDMRDKRHGEVIVQPLFTHYNVRSIRELKHVADAILKRLAAAKQ